MKINKIRLCQFGIPLALILYLVYSIRLNRIVGSKNRIDRPLNWLEQGIVYQIYPRSFQDSDGDGIGDLKGITSRLDYFVELGVNTLWISPIFKSPMVDFGYDISDYTDIDPIFGTIEVFTQLTAVAKSKGLKIVLDMVLNHSSDEHIWFNQSVNSIEPYRDYYVWRNGKGPGGTEPPTNWISVFGGSMWTYNEVRGQWYLHQYAKQQPDINYMNPLVHAEVANILRFWLDRGVGGFRVDAVSHFYEDPTFPDEPPSGNPKALPDEYRFWNHDQITSNRDETYDVITEMRQVLQEYDNVDGQHRILMTEAYVPTPNSMRYYGNESYRLADFPFNFGLITNLRNCIDNVCKQGLKGTPFDGFELEQTIRGFLDNIPSWAGPQSANWVLGNHDKRRISTRFTKELADGMIMVQLLLPGTPVTYYGEEIGMEDTYISWEDTRDTKGCNAGPDRFRKFSRDPERTPMQWNTSFNAGFSTSQKTWLPMANNSLTVNVQRQKEKLVSPLNNYRTLVALRKELSIQSGETGFPVVNRNLFSLSRIRQGLKSFVVLLNLGPTVDRFDLSGVTSIPLEAVVVVRSVQTTNPDTGIGSIVKTNNVRVEPSEGLVLSFMAL